VAVFAGIDEAGYGPTLGPLVVSLAALRAPKEPKRDGAGHDLWARLGEGLLRAPPKRPRGAPKSRAPGDERLIVCDSKKLYQGGTGLRRMEETVLSFLALSRDLRPGGFEDYPEGLRLAPLLSHCGLEKGALAHYPWYSDLDFELPRLSFRSCLRRQGAALRRALAAASIEPLALLPAVFHPREFNDGVRAAGNKHLFEWGIVARFLKLLWDRYAEEGVDLVCDRLSGRDFYGPLLADLFPEARVTAPDEGELRSSYRISRGKREMRITFLVGGDETAFATALASCASKYFRELFMAPLNEWFAARVPGLRPTAGYFQDARRFLDDIAAEWRRLSLPDDLLVRIF
jgi:hypothetical protein